MLCGAKEQQQWVVWKASIQRGLGTRCCGGPSATTGGCGRCPSCGRCCSWLALTMCAHQKFLVETISTSAVSADWHICLSANACTHQLGNGTFAAETGDRYECHSHCIRTPLCKCQAYKYVTHMLCMPIAIACYFVLLTRH